VAPDRVGDLKPLELGEDVLAEEALIGAQKHARSVREATKAPPDKADGTGRRGGVTVAERAVQPLAGLVDEAEQRMPGDPAGVGAARPLPRPDLSVMLDRRRVEVERAAAAHAQTAHPGARSNCRIWPRSKLAKKRPSAVGSVTA
jgi:hypothetical protein